MMINRYKRRLLVAPFAVGGAMMTFAVAAYACTYYVGVEYVAGNITGTTSGSEVQVTGNDVWGSDANGPMTQSVNSVHAQANKWTATGSACGTGHPGCFYVKAGTAGLHSSLNPTSSDIWYDVNTIPVGYTSHTTWGGDPNYDCMDWILGGSSGVKNAGSIKINGSSSGNQGLVTQYSYTSVSGGHLNPTSITAGNYAGPFYIASNETSANTSPQESGVCFSDSSSTNGNQAPLTLV